MARLLLLINGERKVEEGNMMKIQFNKLKNIRRIKAEKAPIERA